MKKFFPFQEKTFTSAGSFIVVLDSLAPSTLFFCVDAFMVKCIPSVGHGDILPRRDLP